MKPISRLIIVSLILLMTVQTSSSQYAVSAEDLNEYISYLASDAMKGRQNGSPEMQEAAEWIARGYEDAGLQVLEGYDSFIHKYQFETRQGMNIKERNVIGILKGDNPDLKNEFILVTAHFDHIGIRRAVNGDSIYNGADDNAAGTVTLLSVARTIREKGLKPGRSIIFAAVSGEEMGLWGSREIAANPPFKLANTFVNINFEMIGHSEYLGRNNYYMTGCEFSNLDDVIKEYSKNKEITLVDTISMGSRLFYMSDNAAFARVKREGDINYGIPSGTFATTTFAPHIHAPIDEAELFDFDNMAALINYFTGMIVFLSNTDEEIEWTDDNFRRLR